MVDEENLVTNNAEWIYDTGVSRHFCANKELMQDFKNMTDGEYVYRENSVTARVVGKGNILLKFTFVNYYCYVMCCMCLSFVET